MARKTVAALLVTALTLGACGTSVLDDPDTPVLQIRSEGGFAPVEWVLGRGPTYTLLADGRLISEQLEVLTVYPAPLLTYYLVTQLGDDDMDRVLDLVADIGLPEMVAESDDSASDYVADATTEVITYWDDNGLHQYSVYALGIEPDLAHPSSAAFAELLAVLDQVVANGDAVPYQPERVRVLAGVAMRAVDPEFQDYRPWPLDDDDPADWDQLELGWACMVYGPEVLDTFVDATQATEWLHPDPMMDAPTFALLVRPLQPGEGDCDIPSPQV